MKRWTFQSAAPDKAALFSDALKIPALVSAVLINRGIAGIEEAETFLSPRINRLRDPFEIPNIKTAVERILLARERHEKVTIYGDYDVDGVTATAILFHTLRLLGIEVDYYIPHRYDEGYSLSLEAIQKLAEAKTNLIITVDCGISSVKEIALANSLGIDVVVTDHHNLPEDLPSAIALVDPKMIAGEHPSKNLAGAGVAFKTAWALLRAAGIKDSVFLTSLLDLAALGTLSDVVPLVGENRIIAATGLNLINERKRSGINELLAAAGVKGMVSENQVYFALAPRINSAGRLEHASKAVELLVSDDIEKIRELSLELNRINIRRQGIGNSIKEEVFAQINETYLAQNQIILLSGNNWNPGVIGITASQAVDAFYRPTVLIGINEGRGRGSARSIGGVNMFELLSSCRDLFLDFGGHAGAAGFSIEPANISILQERLSRKIGEMISIENMLPSILVDSIIEPSDINLNIIKELDKIAPYGEGNSAPVFAARDLALTDVKMVGADGRHLKAWFARDGVNLETIGFGMGKNYSLVPGKKYDIAFNLESNEWNGFEKAQLSLIDIKENSPSIPLS